MNLTRLLLRNLAYHRRGNFAVLLGVAIGAAVLTGALLVGDSLRGSLRDRALARLLGVKDALISPRFVSIKTSQKMAGQDVKGGVLIRGSVTAGDGTRRMSDVTIMDGLVFQAFALSNWQREPDWRPWQVDPVLRPPHRESDVSSPNRWLNGAIVPASIAEALKVKVGDEITLTVQKRSDVPRESLLGRRDAEEAVAGLSLPIAEIVPDDHPASNFSLVPGVGTPHNIYVPTTKLMDAIGQSNRVDLLFCDHGDRNELQAALRQSLTLDDWGLILHTPESRTETVFAKLDTNKDGTLDPREYRNRLAAAVVANLGGGTITRDQVLAYYRKKGYLDLESRQMIVEPAVERAAIQTARDMNLPAAPTLVYLANSIGDGKQAIPYSTVAALDPSLPMPLGPFLAPVADASGSPRPLADDEILLADWKESPLAARPGDRITVTYFEPEQEGRLKEVTTTFKLRGLVPLTGGAADPDLTPEFPGITDKLSLQDWNPPFPYDNSKVSKRDENYWDRFRTTPKAYVTLAAGQKLFGSRFGRVTSIRLAPPAGSDLADIAREFEKRLLANLDPAAAGMVFEDVRARALAASAGGTDFGGLFLGFSFFLIAAALMLVGLLFRLNLERRASEIGLLLATGYRTSTVRWLLLTEGAFLALAGGLVGLAGAVGYAWLMLKLLAALWPDPEIASFLNLHVTAATLAIGYGGALAVSVMTIAWAVRVLGKVAPSALLAGVVRPEKEVATAASRWPMWVIAGGVAGALAAGVGGHFTNDVEAQAGSFFTSGLLFLVAALVGAWAWMRGARHGTIRPGERWPLTRLGIRNAARNPSRSLLTAGLLASAAFLLVAVESFRRSPDGDFLAKTGGSGGFALVGESDLPLYSDLNSDAGRQEILDELEKRYQRDPATKAAKLDAARQLLSATTFAGLRVKAGDDASCLNLYQPGRPRIFGVPRSLIERGGFRFAATEKAGDANPWHLLTVDSGDGAVPVFGEANTLQWILKRGVGESLDATDGDGQPFKLHIAGALQDSVFQGELLMSEAHFFKRYPRQEGYSFFLIDAPSGRDAEVRELLEAALANRGFAVTPAKERLASFLAVENTYLSTFQVLGGFGLLLGASGLAVVLLRGVWERRGELALLRALGFRHRALGWLVFSENAFLLLVGLAAGVGSAVLAVVPHRIVGAAVPWPRLAVMLGLVLVVGLLAGIAAVRATLRAPLVPALRRE